MKPNFRKMSGLVPAVIQDITTREVLMVGFMDKAAWEKTVSTNRVTFWSRTRKKLWTKGETSGNFLVAKEVYLDCDQDTILIQADPQGPTCHTGQKSCFFNKVK